MESSETPLDVLSRAASLVGKSDHRQTFRHTMDKLDNQTCYAINELPTGVLKHKRNKDRPYMDSKYSKKCAGTQTGEDVDNAGIKLECSNDYCNPHSPLNTRATNLSKFQQRPSVITCTSSILHTSKFNNHHYISPHNNNNTEIKHGHRRQVSSGMCDPVIEEHFRRSLGKDYPEFLSSASSANAVSVTVDDHFAKALGETWLQLQAKEDLKNNESTSSHSMMST